jgi:deoxyribodipyrimidine photo-lyase
MNTLIVLFTRDLRVRDHPALTAAARDADRIVPAFVLDEKLLAGHCSAPNRLVFLADSLRDLDESLRARGARLIVRRGDPVGEVLRVARTTDADGIYLSDDVSGYARRRWRRLAEECTRGRIALRAFPGVTAVPGGELLPAGGDHYRIFTPYWRAWRGAERRAPLRAPRRLSLPAELDRAPGPDLRRLSGAADAGRLPDGGETAGRAELERWLRRGRQAYERRAELLAADATSRLSPYLHFGCLSATELLDRARKRWGGEAVARQLCWRDFHHQVLAARPDLPRVDYRRPRRWRQDGRLLHLWSEGRTGYPIVDAGMRQLAEEGFMHNRARLIAGSFLTKTLGIDWRLGAAHFERLLLDADLACNVGNWQWVAGTGNDTRPNRILNPLRQARRFDPDGDYVRRYLSELRGVEGGAVHEPWRLAPDRRRALGYPDPIVAPPASSPR